MRHLALDAYCYNGLEKQRKEQAVQVFKKRSRILRVKSWREIMELLMMFTWSIYRQMFPLKWLGSKSRPRWYNCWYVFDRLSLTFDSTLDAEPNFMKCNMFLYQYLCWSCNNIPINQSMRCLQFMSSLGIQLMCFYISVIQCQFHLIFRINRG